MWDKIKSLIGSAAPLIGAVIGGPAGGAVGGNGGYADIGTVAAV